MGEFGEYVILYLVAFTLSVFLVPAVRRLAIRVGAVDIPDRVRKIHTHAVPRMGGVAIFIAFIVPVVGSYVVGRLWYPESLTFVEIDRQIVGGLGLLAAASLMLVLGIYDDIRHASPKLKLLVQFAAGAILCAVGITISDIRDPLTGSVIPLSWLAYPLTIFWVMAITNAINLIDGMDGLGPGVGLFVAGTMFVVSLFYGVPLVSTVTSVLVGAIIGFLIFNFHPAKIFMGDSGSLFIGFLLAAVSVQASVKRALLVPVIALALPIVDTCMAIVRRWSKGLPMSVPDKQHVHHRLMQMGFSQRQAVFVLYGVSAILGCAALALALMQNRTAAVIAYGFILAAIVVLASLLGGRDLWTLVRRIVDVRRRRLARNRAWVATYATAAKMQGAEGVAEAWAAIEELLVALDLDLARVSASAGGAPPLRLEWTRSGASPTLDADGLLREGWTLRLPLADAAAGGPEDASSPPGERRWRGEMVFARDARRGPLPEALDEMIRLLRVELLKALARLDTGGEAAALRISEDASVLRITS